MLYFNAVACLKFKAVLCPGAPVADTSQNVGGGGGGGEIFNMYAFGVRLRYANLSNIMFGISNSLFNYCNVTITLYTYILVCFLVPLAPKQHKLCYLVPGGGGGGWARVPLGPPSVRHACALYFNCYFTPMPDNFSCQGKTLAS